MTDSAAPFLRHQPAWRSIPTPTEPRERIRPGDLSRPVPARVHLRRRDQHRGLSRGPGISHLYSRRTAGRAGSAPGYDVIDHSRRERGAGQGRKDTPASASRSPVTGSGRSSTGAEPQWRSPDVETHGGGTCWRTAVEPIRLVFDVDWDPPRRRLRNTVLMPVLGEHYGREWKRAPIRLRQRARVRGRLPRAHAFPLARPHSTSCWPRRRPARTPDALAFIADALARLPLSTARTG